jgi:hypothetical protein
LAEKGQQLQAALPDEVDCNIDEEFDNEQLDNRLKNQSLERNNINNSFINKLRDFSTFNPSGNKGREKINNSCMIVIP